MCVCVCVCVCNWGVTRLQPSIGATGDEFPNCLLLSTLDPEGANKSQSDFNRPKGLSYWNNPTMVAPSRHPS